MSALLRGGGLVAEKVSVPLSKAPYSPNICSRAPYMVAHCSVCPAPDGCLGPNRENLYVLTGEKKKSTEPSSSFISAPYQQCRGPVREQTRSLLIYPIPVTTYSRDSHPEKVPGHQD
ncbi:unnamed protein product [Pleuronectes platessa]|uniref:Uncharacterized protein n=1 Tax=Pleuronectes platessa TaxID=8262 RepID=A0A9N7UE11_PLEPL|nr:unnamed protein product [Pleuronectes platessa]